MDTQQDLATRLKRSPIKSARLVSRDENGAVTSLVIYQEKNKKRRVPKRWRGLEKVMRRMGSAQQTAASTYLDKHNQSNTKKKNGWLKDLRKNVSKARRRGVKKLKLKI